MKKFIAVMVAMVMISCSSEKVQKKMTGVVKTFNPVSEVSFQVLFGRSIIALPRIDFSDGRYVYLFDMPDSPINTGDSIAICYSEKKEGCLVADSVVVF